MAELRVEPKKKTKYLPWILLAIGLIALAIFLMRRSGSSDMTANANGEDRRDTAAVNESPDAIAATGVETITSADAWGNVDRYGPALDYPELKSSKNVQVRGNEHYAVYDLGEDVLFDKDKNIIRPDAAAQLKVIASSIDQRFAGGPIRLFGFTDAQGNAAFNKELAQARAEAVRDWLVSNANIDKSRMSIEAVGEGSPKASNKTEAGRQVNRRVQIVVQKSSGNN